MFGFSLNPFSKKDPLQPQTKSRIESEKLPRPNEGERDPLKYAEEGGFSIYQSNQIRKEPERFLQSTGKFPSQQQNSLKSIRNPEHEIEKLKTDLIAQEIHNKTLVGEQRKDQEKIKELKARLEAFESTYNEDLQRENQKLKTEIDSLQSSLKFELAQSNTLKSTNITLLEQEKSKLQRKDREIQQKTNENEKIERDLVQLREELQNSKSQNDQLQKCLAEEINAKEFELSQKNAAEAKQDSMEKQYKKKLEVEINNRALQNSILQKKDEEYQKLELEFQSQRKQLEEKLSVLEIKTRELESANSQRNQLEGKLAVQEIKIRELESANSQLQKEISSILQMGESIHQEIGKETPFISIENASLFALPRDSGGWTIRIQSLTTIKTQETVVLGMMGPLGSGKSWLANFLAGGGLPYGPGENFLSHHLTAFYPNFLNSGDHICVIDQTGFDKPNPHSKSITARLQENTSESKNDAKRILRQYQVLDEDMKIINELEQSFMIDEASLLLYVTNELSQNDIRNICKIQQKLLNQQSGKKLIVIHNLRFLKKKVHVDRYLQSLINLTPKNLWTGSKNKTLSENHFSSLYKDDFGVTHLIMAQMESEAGNFFNKGAIDWLRDVILVEEKKALDITKKFVGFCNTHLSRLTNNEIYVTYDENSSKIMAQKDCLIQPDFLCLNNTPTHFAIDGFKPQFSIVIERQSEEMVKYEVYVELLDAKVEKKNLKLENGRWYLILVGMRDGIYKSEYHNKEGVTRVKGTREEGNFHLVIPLCQDDMKFKQQSDPFDTGLGLIKYSYTFEENHEEMMC